MGDGGTGGSTFRGGGLGFDLNLKGRRDENPNDVLVAGAEGGGMCKAMPGSVIDRRMFSVEGLAVKGVTTCKDDIDLSLFQSGEELLASSSVVSPLGLLVDMLGASKPPPTPSSSSCSPSSTRSSLMMLPDVKSLAMDPVRARPEYRLFQAGPIPIPVEDPSEEPEALRATMRSSIALSKARASRITSTLSRSLSVLLDSSSIKRLRLPHSSSSSATAEDLSDAEGDLSAPLRTLSYSRS